MSRDYVMEENDSNELECLLYIRHERNIIKKFQSR